MADRNGTIEQLTGEPLLAKYKPTVAGVGGFSWMLGGGALWILVAPLLAVEADPLDAILVRVLAIALAAALRARNV